MGELGEDGVPSPVVDAGPFEDLERAGHLVTKVGDRPVCVFWHDGRADALDDRCPHLGFPLHRGTVESGLVTCHWHHARFDLCSGATLDPFADDARAYRVEVRHGRVLVQAGARPVGTDAVLRRVVEGLEQGLTLVLAKSVLALLAEGVSPSVVVHAGARFGCRFRGEGFGPGLTVLCAVANVLDRLDAADRPLALVHGLAFVSRDTRGRPPWFPLDPLAPDRAPLDRLAGWYRRFVETRAGDAAERTLATAVASGMGTAELCALMGAAVTDHVFVDEGHVVDFTNKAFELADHLAAVDAGAPGWVLPTLAHETARAVRHEEEGAWRHPHDLAAMAVRAGDRICALADAGGWAMAGGPAAEAFEAEGRTSALGWSLLADDPSGVVDALFEAIERGASAEQLARAVAFAAALRIVRFHTQNDHGDWDVVHHGFTAANALHQLVCRAPAALLVRGVVHGALKVFLDRFLNVPAARLPRIGAAAPDLGALQACWDTEGGVDEAGAVVFGHLRHGGSREEVVAALGAALLREDAGFHWFQIYEAAVRQAFAWPEGSEEAALVLAGAARFLSAHTPTRRELAQVVRIASRLQRGDVLYADVPSGDDDDAGPSDPAPPGVAGGSGAAAGDAAPSARAAQEVVTDA